MKRHFLSILLVSMSFLVLAQAPALAQDKPAKPASGETAKPEAPVAGPNVACDVNATVQQCCSAAKCGGDVLSNRDAHNCKVKSSGKSWHPAARNGQPAACQRM